MQSITNQRDSNLHPRLESAMRRLRHDSNDASFENLGKMKYFYPFMSHALKRFCDISDTHLAIINNGYDEDDERDEFVWVRRQSFQIGTDMTLK